MVKRIKGALDIEGNFFYSYRSSNFGIRCEGTGKAIPLLV